MTHPLEGIRVLDLTRLLPGGVLTMMLADMGADVVKIEAPGGGDYARWMPPLIDGQSPLFRMNNRGKRSAIVNLKHKQGAETLHRLVQSADVLVESFRPGVMARLGCDYESLKTVNPRLVYCALSGWGADGPYANDPHHDLNYVSRAGFVGAMADPQPPGGQIADIGGAYVALSGILAALFRRECEGVGGFVDTSLAESALLFSLFNWVDAISRGSAPGQGELTGGLACYRVYTASDGEPVALAPLEPKFWANFCHTVNRTDWIEGYTEPDRQAGLIAQLTELFATKSATEWDALLGKADCCFTRVTRPVNLAEDPHFSARGMLGTFDDSTAWMRSPVRIHDSEPHIENTAPGYGTHTREVFLEAGFDAGTIDDLLASGVIQDNSST